MGAYYGLGLEDADTGLDNRRSNARGHAVVERTGGIDGFYSSAPRL
jgi:hypothetical protein